jgi:transposase, IS605 orfB family
MLRSIKIRLYPTAHQATQINRLLGSCRVVYNQTLDRKINQYKEHNISENRTTLSYWFHHELLNNPDFEYLKEQNTKVLNQSINDMITAYDRFFKLHTGYPKFKSKHNNKQSCRFPCDAISKRNIYTNYKLSLTNIKNIKFRCNKKYAEYLQKNKANIRQATLSKLPCGEFYLSILVDGDLTHKGVKDTNNYIGIDLGVKDFVITSEGEIFNNLHFKKNEIHKLKKLQKQLSRKVKGSNNRNKARINLAKVYNKINDKKQYYLHQVSNSLINENQVICMENLNVKGMLKNHKLAESISEMNFGEFKRILEYKARWYNRKIVFVDRFYPSSKTCCHCSYKFKDLKLSDRFWTCPQCGTHHDRDINAAVNILNEGLRIIGSSTTEFKLVDYPTMDGDSVMDQKSSDRLKQEVNKEQNSNLFKF